MSFLKEFHCRLYAMLGHEYSKFWMRGQKLDWKSQYRTWYPDVCVLISCVCALISWCVCVDILCVCVCADILCVCVDILRRSSSSVLTCNLCRLRKSTTLWWRRCSWRRLVQQESTFLIILWDWENSSESQGWIYAYSSLKRWQSWQIPHFFFKSRSLDISFALSWASGGRVNLKLAESSHTWVDLSCRIVIVRPSFVKMKALALS